MISTTVRAIVKTRSHGMCELCGLPCPSPHLHHRQARGMGGGGNNTAANLIALHPSCHLKHVEQHRTRAYENGWLVRHGHDPADVPLRYMLDEMVLLDEAGNIVPQRTMIAR